MDLDKRDCENIQKFDIKLKSKPKDGVILQLHHTVKGSNGECRRIRFSSATFDDMHEKLACADNVGNLFILDFSDLKFWKLSGIVGPCTALSFVANRLDTLVVATAKKFEINFLDVETANISLTLTGHTAPVKHISFSNNKTNNLLTASPVEAILWEQRNYTKYFTLNTYLGAQIQQITFTPGGEYLVACFQNDTIQIWRHENMKSVKQIIPNDIKHLKNVAFTMNGRAMAMAGLTPTLILFSMDTWKALKTIDLSKFDISGINQVAFIPQVFDGGANKVLGILSSDCVFYMLDLESTVILHSIRNESSGIRKIVVSPTGKYFLCILQLGEVNIYNTSSVMDLRRNAMGDHTKHEVPCTSTHKHVLRNQASKTEIEQKMKTCMDSARLRRILMQYGEYPDKFRSIIWRSLLNTPRNKDAYCALLDKGVHPVYRDIERQFTIHSSMTLKNLKRLLSCLAHWCPLFAVMKFLPGFVFPFVKVLQKDPLLLFECVATVLLNYCQLWFEYAPFPPISILSIIENILAEHDPQLLDHFCKLGITSQIYALKILETAFSEVLSCSEWLILWDHILSNEPSFILMAVVAYSIVQKNAIKKIQSYEQMETFFHMQNPICKKAFLKKSYYLLNETPDDIHPKKFFSSFVSLEKGDCYQQFTGYPKATICLKLAEKERKKAMKHKKHTLKELTRISLEKVNSQQSKLFTNGSKTDESDDDSLENVFISENYASMKRKEKTTVNDAGLSKGDSCGRKTYTKEEILKTIQVHPTILHKDKLHSEVRHKKDRDKDIYCSKQPTKMKKMSVEKRTENLEREVERLIKKCGPTTERCDV